MEPLDWALQTSLGMPLRGLGGRVEVDRIEGRGADREKKRGVEGTYLRIITSYHETEANVFTQTVDGLVRVDRHV